MWMILFLARQGKHGGNNGKPRERRTGRVEGTAGRKSNRGSEEGQYVYGGGGILWTHFKGRKTESSTRKLLSIQKWELPGTVTALRNFLGLTNYFSSYVHNYVALAAPLMGKLQVNRLVGNKGSFKPVAWDDESKAAFEALK